MNIFIKIFNNIFKKIRKIIVILKLTPQIQGMTKKISQSDKKIFIKWQKNFHKMTKKFSQNDKNINNYKTIKLTKNVTENCYASYN